MPAQQNAERSSARGLSVYEEVEDTDANIFGTQIKADAVDERKDFPFSLQPSECSLPNARIIHGANASPKRRAGHTMRYFSTTSKINKERNLRHKLWLARGADIAGNLYENA